MDHNITCKLRLWRDQCLRHFKHFSGWPCSMSATLFTGKCFYKSILYTRRTNEYLSQMLVTWFSKDTVLTQALVLACKSTVCCSLTLNYTNTGLGLSTDPLPSLVEHLQMLSSSGDLSEHRFDCKEVFPYTGLVDIRSKTIIWSFTVFVCLFLASLTGHGL